MSKLQIINSKSQTIKNKNKINKTNQFAGIWSLFVICYLFIGICTALSGPAYASNISAEDILSDIPVQHGGRVKPFQSFAQESVLYITGKSHFQGISAVRLVWQWIADPEKWKAQPLIPVSYQPLQQEFSVMVIRGRIAPQLVLENQPFVEKVKAAAAKKSAKEKLTALEQKQIELFERASLFQAISEGDIPGWLAHPEDPRVGWLPLRVMLDKTSADRIAEFYPETLVQAFTQAIRELTAEFQSEGSESVLAGQADHFSHQFYSILESRGVVLDQKLLKIETTYNHLRPFTQSWKLYTASALGWLVLILFGFTLRLGIKKIILGTAGLLFTAGFLLHTYGFYLRCMIAGRPPVTNMYESVIWVSWAVVFFSAILAITYRSVLIPFIASLVASLALIIAQSFPTILDPFVSPLVPVLRSNMWLTVHVLTITLSYGAFLLVWGIGHAIVLGFAFSPSNRELYQRLSQYLYRALQIGVVLLAAGTVLGGVWANYSWGRFWGWDPKETWALIALLGYVTVLHGRFAGWLGTFGFCLGATAAFLGILMAWYGVNFVLAAGLHSYGFGGGGLPYVALFVLIDLILLGCAAVVFNKRKTLISGKV